MRRDGLEEEEEEGRRLAARRYQLHFRTPMMSPSEANSLKQILHRPNRLK